MKENTLKENINLKEEIAMINEKSKIESNVLNSEILDLEKKVWKLTL